LTVTGHWTEPHHALVVPPDLFFEEGPIFTEAELGYRTNKRYQYVDPELRDCCDVDILNGLGVRKLTADLVCSVVSSSSFPFSKKTLSWIRDLFRYLQTTSWSYRIQCKSAMFLRL